MDKKLDELSKAERLIRAHFRPSINIGDEVMAKVLRPYNQSEVTIHGIVVDIKYPMIRVEYMGCSHVDFLFEDVGKTLFIKQKKYFPARGNGKSRESLKQLIEYLKFAGSNGGLTKEEVLDVTDEEMFRRAWRLREELNKLQDESPKIEAECKTCKSMVNTGHRVAAHINYCSECGRRLK